MIEKFGGVPNSSENSKVRTLKNRINALLVGLTGVTTLGAAGGSVLFKDNADLRSELTAAQAKIESLEGTTVIGEEIEAIETSIEKAETTLAAQAAQDEEEQTE